MGSRNNVPGFRRRCALLPLIRMQKRDSFILEAPVNSEVRCIRR